MNKKISLLFASVLGGSMLFAQSQRLVLMEEFTQASCGPCAAANPAFNALLASNTAKVVSIKNQTSWPGVDPMNAQTAAEVAKRVSYYGVTGVPDAFQDGVDYSSPGNVTQSSIDAEYAVPSPFTIQMNHWFNTANDTIYINCTITCTQAVTMTTPFVRIGMVEKTITFSSPPGSNGETVFYNVMRKMYPDAKGTSLATSWNVGDSKTVSFKAKIPSYIYSKPEIAVVGWIQDDATKGVQQAGYSSAASAPLALPPVSDFTADVLTSCDGLINYSDRSALFPTSWSWDFGDGTTSTLKNPSHKYNATGMYTVKLTASNSNGNNLATKTSYVSVNLAGLAPSGVNGVRCGAGVVNLSATPSSGGNLNWYNSSGAVVNTGNSYSPNISTTTSFAVAEMYPNAPVLTGAPDNTMGAGAYFTANTVHGLYFDVAAPCTLVSVDAYANTAGNRTIEVSDATGIVLYSVVKNLPAGLSTISLNFAFGTGVDYFIKVANGSTVDLYRNSAGAVYPYTSGPINVTGNDANPVYYYFFYNWSVKQNDCAGPSVMVTGTDTCSFSGINTVSINNSLSVFPNPVTDMLNLQIALTENANVSLYNVAGALVYKGVMTAQQNQTAKLAIPVSEMNAGMYMLKIETNGTTLYRKIIK